MPATRWKSFRWSRTSVMSESLVTLPLPMRSASTSPVPRIGDDGEDDRLVLIVFAAAIAFGGDGDDRVHLVDEFLGDLGCGVNLRWRSADRRLPGFPCGEFVLNPCSVASSGMGYYLGNADPEGRVLGGFCFLFFAHPPASRTAAATTAYRIELNVSWCSPCYY